jgi:hypothetical protein
MAYFSAYKECYIQPLEFDFYLHIICGQLCACVGQAKSEKIGKFMSGIFVSNATHFSLKVNMHPRVGMGGIKEE